MSTAVDIPAAEAVIVMSREFDAPREKVWAATTEPRHVTQWWGGPGFSSPVCEMDLRPGGHWDHVLRFPDGTEMRMAFVFVAVEKPARLVWQDRAPRTGGPPSAHMTVTLEDLGGRTRWRLVARFATLADRDTAAGFGFSRPIAMSNGRLVDYLKTM